MIREELWQGYDERGLPIGPVTLPQCADGALHGASHIWMWRKSGHGVEVLLQTRAKDKRTWPGFLDISAAGHIDFGETPLVAALREAKEEVGIELNDQDLKLLFVARKYIVFKGPQPTIENEFRWIYAHELIDESSLHFSDGEVDDASWMSLYELKRLAADTDSKLVPQGQDYFAMLFAAIERLAKEV